METRSSSGLARAGQLAILGGGMLPAIAAGTMSVMLPGINDQFNDGTNGVYVKMVATALGLGMMIGAPLSGYVADRVGRRPVLLLAAIIFGLAGCSVLLMTQLWQLIAIRFIIGLTAGTMSTCMVAVISDHFSGPQQNRWLGYNAAVATFAILILNPLAGALADTGWQNGFIIYALAFPVLILIFAGVPGRGQGAPRGATGPDGASAALSGKGVAWSAILLAVVVGTLATGTSLYWPFRFREIGVVAARDIAFYALPNIFLVGATAFSYGFFRRYMNITQIFIMGGVASAIGLIVMGFATTPMLVMTGLAIEGFAVGILTPNLSNYAISISSPDKRASNIGLMKGALFGSPFLTQFGLEPMSQYGGAPFALWTIAAMAVAMVIALVTRDLGRKWQVAAG